MVYWIAVSKLFISVRHAACGLVLPHIHHVRADVITDASLVLNDSVITSIGSSVDYPVAYAHQDVPMNDVTSS